MAAPSLAEIDRQLTTYALIDLDALAYNVRAIRERIGPGVEIFAVVKANAYGHGAVPVAQTALASGATRLAVARTDEGVELRRAGLTAPILIMTYTLPAEAGQIVAHDLTATVNTIEGAEAIAHQARAMGKTASVHIKVETGMGRYGLLPEELVPFLNRIRALPGLELEGIFTHFAVADSADKSYTRDQFARFQAALSEAEQAGFRFPIRHAANSAATLDLPDTYLDAVRPGIILYGLYPSPDVSRLVALRPVLSLRSHAGRVRVLPAGSSVGYGRTFTARRPTRVVLVPVGYGDGYHRLLSNRGAVLVRGQRAPIIGRVCMDQLMVDATDIPGVEQDDPIVLIGTHSGTAITADEVAGWAETINYEVVTGLARRVPRVYVRAGQVVGVERLA